MAVLFAWKFDWHESLIGGAVLFALKISLFFLNYFGYSDNSDHRCKSKSARIKVIIKRHA